MTLEHWCRACGESAGPSDTRCRRCGVPVAGPDVGAVRVGTVISVKGRMMQRRNGIALHESDGIVRVLVSGDETVKMPMAEFDAAKDVDVPGPPVYSAAGRLWKAQHAQHRQVIDVRWNDGPVTEAARVHATDSVGARRAAALDALALGADDLLLGLGLTSTEVAWYQARTAAGRGDARATLGWLERLPARGYELRVTLLLTLSDVLLSDPALGARAASQLAPFAAVNLDARALHAALAEPGEADVLAPLVPFAAAVPDDGSGLVSWARTITGEDRPALPLPDGLPVTAALDTYLRFRAGTSFAATVSSLRCLPLPLLDEMIDDGVVPTRLPEQPGWDAGRAAYLRCRLTPGGTGLPDLTAAGFTAELARRHYLFGDVAALDALPSDDEAVRHYRALLPWGPGPGKPGLDGLRPQARLVLGQVAEVQDAARAGQSAMLSEELAADPTCWPLLWQSVLQGAPCLPEPLAGRYPRFAEWLALCGIQRLLFQSRWDDALDAGRALADRTRLEVTSDEALNMVAFALQQVGRPASALQTLDEALGGRYTTGLLVNASIVAASQGAAAAFPYLARILREERDPSIRGGAVERAIALWQEDETSSGYPDDLRALVRQALAEPQADELHQTLLRLACGQDRDWLADGGTVRSVNPDQVAWERYQRAWARRQPDGSQAGLADVARVLADLVKTPSAPAWAAAELRRFVADLDEAVHVDFGDPAAVALVPTIEVLIDAGVLDPAYRIVFPVQAAAHTAMSRHKEGKSIDPDDEQRMLFDTARIYVRRWSEVPAADREFVDGETLRCVKCVAAAVTDTLTDNKVNLAGRYNALVERQRHAADYERERIVEAKRKLLNGEYKPLHARLSRYHVLLGELTLDESGRSLRDEIGGILQEWAKEIKSLGG